MKTIQYYFSPKSPWTYFGHAPLLSLAKSHGASVEPTPTDLGKIFPISGGRPWDKRPQQRQAYRIHELQRMSSDLHLPLHIHTQYFPFNETNPPLIHAPTTKT